MFKKTYPFQRVRPVWPERSRREDRSRFDARSVRCVRERERREERQVCEPESGKKATLSGRSQGTPLAALRPDSGQACFNLPRLEWMNDAIVRQNGLQTINLAPFFLLIRIQLIDGPLSLSRP